MRARLVEDGRGREPSSAHAAHPFSLPGSDGTPCRSKAATGPVPIEGQVPPLLGVCRRGAALLRAARDAQRGWRSSVAAWSAVARRAPRGSCFHPRTRGELAREPACEPRTLELHYSVRGGLSGAKWRKLGARRRWRVARRQRGQGRGRGPRRVNRAAEKARRARALLGLEALRAGRVRD